MEDNNEEYSEEFTISKSPEKLITHINRKITIEKKNSSPDIFNEENNKEALNNSKSKPIGIIGLLDQGDDDKILPLFMSANINRKDSDKVSRRRNKSLVKQKKKKKTHKKNNNKISITLYKTHISIHF